MPQNACNMARKIYRNPHDTKILRGLYSAFLIYFAGFNLGKSAKLSLPDTKIRTKHIV